MSFVYESEKLIRIPIKDTNEECAFNQILSPYYDSLKTYCLHITKSAWDADDLMQITLTKVYRKYAEQSQLTISKTFLYKVAMNTWIDECRRKKIPQTSLIELAELKVNKPDYLDTKEALEKMVTTLTPKQSVCFFLHDVLQFTPAEIGERLRTTEGAVKSLLHRARTNLASVKSQDLDDYSERLKVQQNDEDQIYQFLDALDREDPGPIVHLFEQEDRTAPKNQFVMPLPRVQRVGSSTPSMMMAA